MNFHTKMKLIGYRIVTTFLIFCGISELRVPSYSIKYGAGKTD